MELDQFSWYQTKVKEYLDEYTQVMKKYAPDYVGYSKTINQLAQPFINGYFTLAIVGKMSAGKSTFINALIGDKNVLPTDHLQTTCTLTKIRHGANKRIEVTYADGHKVAIENDIEIGLKKLVAIPDAYRDLPINQINNMIVGGLSQDEIVKQQDYLKEKVAKNIDLKVLKEYIKSHDKTNIPAEVIIELPLPMSYRGWQIVDTPGIDAIGGIEDTTNDFLSERDEQGNSKVDAIIFVHSAKWQIEDGSLNNFVRKTYNSLTDAAKKRIFLVLTHASDSDFMINKDVNIDNAVKLFVDYRYNLNKDRLVCVDSLLSLLYAYIDKEGIQAQLITSNKNTPVGWLENEWKACKELVRKIKGHLEEDEKEENNENILNLMEEIAGFTAFRTKMNDFVKTEKKQAFKAFVKRIVIDLSSCVSKYNKRVKILKKKASLTQAEFERTIDEENQKLQECTRDINLKLDKIRDDFPNEVDKEFKKNKKEYLTSFDDLNSHDEIIPALNIVRDKLIVLQRKIFKDLSNILEQTINLEETDVFFEPLDCKFIIDSAKSNLSDKDQFITKEKDDAMLSSLWRFLGLGGYVDKYNEKAHITDVKGKLVEQFKQFLCDTKKSVLKVITESGELISHELKIKLEKQTLEYSELKFYGEDFYAKQESEICGLESVIDQLRSVQQKIKEETKND